MKSINLAIELLRSSFGGISVAVLNNELIINPYNNELGVFIEIVGVKSFLSKNIADDMIKYGSYISDQFIYIALSDLVISMKRDGKIDDIFN